VAALPPRKRAARLRRFRQVQAVVAEAGKQAYQGSVDPASRFLLNLPCPFLDKESCAIHVSRPAVCREHLALSEARHCGSWPSYQVRLMPVSHGVWEAMGKVCAELLGTGPLTLAMEEVLDWTEENRSLGGLRWPAEKVARALADQLFSPKHPKVIEGTSHVSHQPPQGFPVPHRDP
jgi:Fe-S-cluster containining protein